MQINTSISNRFSCPICGSKVEKHAEFIKCINEFCKEEYPLLNQQIPIFIDDKGSVFSKEDFLSQSETFFKNSYHNPLRAFIKKIAPDISHNIKAEKNLESFCNFLLRLNPKPTVLVVGGGIKGEGFKAFEKYPQITLVATDVSIGPETQIIADAHSLPFLPETFDGVVVQAVLEHVLNPNQCVNEIYRVLKPEGLIYAETPFMQQVHGGAYDFTRFTKLGHRWLLRDFTELESGIPCGPGMALAWSYEFFLCSFGSSKIYTLLAKTFARITGFWLKYFDYFLLNRKKAHYAASAFYFIGQKSEIPIAEKEILGLF